MNEYDQLIEGLAESARRAALPGDEEPPLGFATRVLAGVRPEAGMALWRRLDWAALVAAALICIACLGWEWTAPPSNDTENPTEQFIAGIFEP